MKAIPGGMLELVGNSLPERAVGVFGYSVENLFSTHDPEHIESPQGIKGIESLGRRGWLHMNYEYKKFNNF
jgi:hypothetical protein